MGACGEPGFVQIALTPTPALFERFARRLFKLREERLSRQRRAHAVVRDRSMVEDAELRGGLDVQHRPLFFVDIRVAAADRATCERVASELRAESAENRLVERGTARPPRPPLALCPSPAARRGQSAAVISQGGLRDDRAGGDLAPAVDRLHDGAVCPQRAAACAGPAVDSAPARRGGDAARRARAGLDPPRAAQAEHGGARRRRAGQVELPDRDRRRGPAPRALRGDRARPQGRRGRRRREPRARATEPARCSTSPIRPAASTRSPSTPRPT